MRIAEVRVRQVAVPRIYDTYCADPKNLKNTIDHGRSTYQIIELKTRGGPSGTGEVSDIAPRMNAPSAEALQTLLSGALLDGDVRAWRSPLRPRRGGASRRLVSRAQTADPFRGGDRPARSGGQDSRASGP